MSGRYAALLRGINVGGHHRLPMKDLRDLAEQIGATDVATYIQSGNLVFTADRATAGVFCEKLGKAIGETFGFEVPVVLRSSAELRKAVAANPFVDEGSDPAHLHYMFLASRPARGDVAGLDAERSLPDRFAVKGKEIYVHCPNGLARTKLSNVYFDKALKTVSTSRNAKTVAKILEMLG